jgi:hypothetical protein
MAWEEACLWMYLSIGPVLAEQEKQFFGEIFFETRQYKEIAFSCSSDGVALPPTDKLSPAGDDWRLII